MAQQPKHLTPTASALDFFGALMRDLRERGGLSAAELASQLFVGPDLVRKVEVAERYPSDEFIDAVDDALGAGGLLRGMGPLLAREQALKPRQRSAPARFAPEANDSLVLDWLLMDANWENAREADEAVQPRLSELRHADHRGGAGMTYPRILTVLGDGFDQLVSEDPRTGIGVLELAAYNAVDLGDDAAAQRHYHQALTIALRSGHRRHAAHLIASLAYLTMQCGHPRAAVRLAQAVIGGVAERTTPVEGAVWWMIKARSHALMGERSECVVALGQAEEHLSSEPRSGEVELISYFSEADLADERAHCFFDLEEFSTARDEAAKAVALFGPERVRRHVIDSSLYAAGLARTGELEHASAVARGAIQTSGALRSFRASQALAEMMAELLPHREVRAVEDAFEFARIVGPVAPVIPGSDRRS